MEYWNVGMMEKKSKRNAGMLECWKSGKMASGFPFFVCSWSFHLSIIPEFQNSILPSSL